MCSSAMHQRMDSEILSGDVSWRTDWRASLKVENEAANVEGGTVEVDVMNTIMYSLCVQCAVCNVQGT